MTLMDGSALSRVGKATNSVGAMELACLANADPQATPITIAITVAVPKMCLTDIYSSPLHRSILHCLQQARSHTVLCKLNLS